MAFSDWLLICGTGLLIKSRLSQVAEERAEELEEYKEYMEKLKFDEIEQDRRSFINQNRKLTICTFCDGISKEEFEEIAKRISKKIKRIQKTSIENAIITCVVSSQTGCSEWEFSVDFNNWGHITGTHWTLTDNFDSSIPQHYGDLVASEIHSILDSKSIELKDLSDEVDKNTYLAEDTWEHYIEKDGFIKKLFKKNTNITLEYNYDNLINEHLFVVFSILKNRGCKNITAVPIYDTDNKNSEQYYKVGQIITNGILGLNNNIVSAEDEIIIKYHYKRKIVLPFNAKFFKKKDYKEVKSNLEILGFKNIEEEKIDDLITGWITKVGSVEDVLISEESIKSNKEYFYDDIITIKYHTKS